MATSSNKYKCKYCTHEYKEKFNYDRHVGFCEFSFKSTREVESEIEAFDKTPTVAELFGYIKELSVRFTKLEKENAQLKQFARQQKKRVDILDWLNNRYDCVPDSTFTSWMTAIPVETYLDEVFEYDLLTALIKCFDAVFENNDKMPVCAFSQKANIFYVYDKSTDLSEDTYKWSQISNKQMNKWFSYMSQKMIAAFKNWYETNKEFIDSNEQEKEKYYDYFQKVLGGKMSDETRNQRLRQFCYTKIKQNLKTVVEFEFV
jgi:hypothetical protein